MRDHVLFDPDYHRNESKLNCSVSLEEALQIVALNQNLLAPGPANTIFIAGDTAKREDIEQSVIKTFISNLSQPTELQDVVNALRQILEISRIQPLPSEGAIVVRGTPDQVALAEKLVTDLDKSKPEVVVDVAILQISKDKKRTLGVNPPTSMTVQLQPNVNTTTTTVTNGTNAVNGTNSTSNGTNGANGAINLNALGNLNATDFQVTISPANVSALFSDAAPSWSEPTNSLDRWAETRKIGDRVRSRPVHFNRASAVSASIHWSIRSSSISMSVSTLT